MRLNYARTAPMHLMGPAYPAPVFSIYRVYRIWPKAERKKPKPKQLNLFKSI